MNKYLITSDWHFNHVDTEDYVGILKFERGNKFNSIEAHDAFIVNKVQQWLNKLDQNDTFYFLGDFGKPCPDIFAQLQNAFDNATCKKVAVRGNHDNMEVMQKMSKLFDEVHEYPLWISKRIVLSHMPTAVWEDEINIHGHLHNSILMSNNHLCASIHVAHYQPITTNMVMKNFKHISKRNRCFLWEPWADMYQFTTPREDIVCDKDGLIDLPASRELYS